MRLSDFISKNLESVLDEWETYAREVPAGKDLKVETLRDHARQMLQTIIEDLNTVQSVEEQSDKSKGYRDNHAAYEESGAEKHGASRGLSGFTIEELIAEFRALRATVLHLWGKSSKHAQQSDLDDMTRFNEAIDQAVAESVTRYSSKVKQAQDLFLGILGHDLRNPLGAITMSAEVMMKSASLDSRYVRFASMIYKNANEMSELIRDLLDFTRTRLGQEMPIKRDQVNLENIVGQAVDSARAFHPKSFISLDFTGDLSGHWDAGRMGQVFSNLIGNAIKYGDRNKPIEVVLSSYAEHIVATVHNSGDPILESEIFRIFEPLHRSTALSTVDPNSDGLGLGLYIVQEIVHAHEGRVTVTSSSAEGTTFTVELPRRIRSQ